MKDHIYVGMVSNSPKDGVVEFLHEKNIPTPHMERISADVEAWVLENNLVEHDDFEYAGDCTIVLKRDGSVVRTIFHGIRFLVPELETAFRLRFLCK